MFCHPAILSAVHMLIAGWSCKNTENLQKLPKHEKEMFKSVWFTWTSLCNTDNDLNHAIEPEIVYFGAIYEV